MRKKVALIGDNSVEYIEQLLSIWNEKNCAVLIDWRIPFNKIYSMMRSVGVEECIVEKKYLKNCDRPTSISFRTYEIKNAGISKVPKKIVDMYIENTSLEDAVILFSSGTTHNAKGVALSHFAITTNARSIQKYLKLETSTNIQIVKSLSHSSTLVGELLVSLQVKCNIFVSPTLILPNRLLKGMAKRKIDVVCVNPELLCLYCDLVEKNDFHYTIKNIYVSGSILSPNLLKRAKSIFPDTIIANVYGLTEAGPRVTSQMIGRETYVENSVGKPLDGVRIRIEIGGKEVSRMNRGEIVVNTPSRYSYIVEQGKRIINRNLWIHTGDLGYLDENDNLFIVGRVDSMILVKSHNVYPEEVECIINTYPKVRDSFVYKKDDDYICDYVGEPFPANEIKEYLKSKLASYEIPSYFFRKIELPKNNNGKKIRSLGNGKMRTDC